MADSDKWISTTGGDWGVAGNWRNVTTGDNPAIVAPGASDLVTIAGRSDGAFEVISGQGDAASLTTAGNLVFGGLFAAGTLIDNGTLDIAAGTTLTAGSVTLNGSLQASGVGASLAINGTVQLGGGANLSVNNGARASASGAAMSGGYMAADATGIFEIGAAGTAAAGSLVIDPGVTLSASGTIAGSSLINNGVIIATGLLDLFASGASGTGQIQIAAGANLYDPFPIGNGQTIDFLANTGTLGLSFNNANAFAAGVSGFVHGDLIHLFGLTADTATYTPTGSGVGTLTVQHNGTTLTALKLLGDYTNKSFVTNAFNSSTDISVACFAAGTRITTRRGDVYVEDLTIGELVHTKFAGQVPVKWIGHRHIDCSRHPDPRKVWPVRVRAGSFGDARPHRDLWLSPDHAIYVGDVLIPIKLLINDSTIRQIPMSTVTYYHIELQRHDVLFAEGLSTESYLG